MSTDQMLVSVRNLSKHFGKTTALRDITLDIPVGRIIGLLGANGAGKSTLLRHMIGLYLPDSGSCTTLGCSAGELAPEHMARIGYVHQSGELSEWMTARQLLDYVSAYYPTWNHDLEQQYIRDFDVSEKKRIAAMSPGQRQRLSILLAIAFEPDLLLLDEPAAALDPIARMRFLDLVMSFIQTRACTVVISSHILSDVEKIIDHTFIMNNGALIRDCSLDDLREEFCRIRVTSPQRRLPDSLPFTGVAESTVSEHEALLTAKTPSPDEVKRIEQQFQCLIELKPLSLDELYKLILSAD